MTMQINGLNQIRAGSVPLSALTAELQAVINRTMNRVDTTATDGQDEIAIAGLAATDWVEVFLNGVMLNDTEYTVTAGLVTMTVALSAGDQVYVQYGTDYANIADRDWITVSSNRTAALGDRLAVDLTGGSVTVTLPASPVAGRSKVAFKVLGVSGANLLTILRNGQPIEGVADDITAETAGLAFELHYVNAVYGWAKV